MEAIYHHEPLDESEKSLIAAVILNLTPPTGIKKVTQWQHKKLNSVPRKLQKDYPKKSDRENIPELVVKVIESLSRFANLNSKSRADLGFFKEEEMMEEMEEKVEDERIEEPEDDALLGGLVDDGERELFAKKYEAPSPLTPFDDNQKRGEKRYTHLAWLLGIFNHSYLIWAEEIEGSGCARKVCERGICSSFPPLRRYLGVIPILNRSLGEVALLSPCSESSPDATMKATMLRLTRPHGPLPRTPLQGIPISFHCLKT